VGDRCRVGAQPDDQAHAEAHGEVDHLGSKGPPANIGFGAGEHEDVPVVEVTAAPELDARPRQPGVDPFDQVHDRTPAAVVDQLLGVEAGQVGEALGDEVGP